ncbi:MAG: transcription elongation factor GreA [Patescibacteria group bacterium]|nr:transcription elongation factor GreA [Patescibacteria group bacterium]
MDEKMYLTKEGHEKLKTELDGLLGSERKAVAARIKAAKEHGDLSENSEYSDAKEQQSFVEGRIIELEHILKNAELIDEDHANCSQVNLGCTVHLESSSKDLKYKIVGKVEADPEKGLISNESPIGRALMGKKKGDEVEVSVPAGLNKYKIKKVV